MFPEEISMSRIQFLGTTEQFKDKLWPWSIRNRSDLANGTFAVFFFLANGDIAFFIHLV